MSATAMNRSHFSGHTVTWCHHRFSPSGTLILQLTLRFWGLFTSLGMPIIEDHRHKTDLY